jgi:hypothetical protein
MTGKTVCEQLNNILCKLETEIANRETAYKGSYKGSYKGAYKACWIILTSAQVRVERLEEQGKTSERDAEHAEILRDLLAQWEQLVEIVERVVESEV